VGGVADAQQPRPEPAAQPVHLDPEEAHVLPAGQLPDPVGQERHQLGDRRPEAGQPGRLQRRGRVFGDGVGDLPVGAPVDQHQQVPRGQPAEGLARVAGTARQPEPQHVDGCAEHPRAQPGRAAQARVAAVGGHRQPGADLVLGARLVAVGHPHHPAPLLEHGERLGLHAQLEAGQPAGLADDEVEEVPLGHEGDVPVAAGQPAEVGQGEVAGVGGDLHDRRLAVGQAEQLPGQPELVEQPQGRGMQRVAAEVAQEVGVLLEHQHLDPGPGQQQPEHGPGRPAPGDAAADLARPDLPGCAAPPLHRSRSRSPGGLDSGTWVQGYAQRQGTCWRWPCPRRVT